MSMMLDGVRVAWPRCPDRFSEARLAALYVTTTDVGGESCEVTRVAALRSLERN